MPGGHNSKSVEKIAELCLTSRSPGRGQRVCFPRNWRPASWASWISESLRRVRLTRFTFHVIDGTLLAEGESVQLAARRCACDASSCRRAAFGSYSRWHRDISGGGALYRQ